MRAFITGATGFIGSHLADTLHSRGYDLRCLVRKTSDPKWLRHLPVEYVHGDLFDSGGMARFVAGCDYVYHVAGLTKAKRSEEYFQANHIATRNLLEVVAKANPGLKRFVHVSSQAAVGPSTPDKPVDETTPFHPITAYGVSKMEAEKECLRMMERIPVTITRPPAVYGPRDKDVFQFFLALNRGLQPMIGFGQKYVSLVHVKDLVEGIVRAGEDPKSAGETYFISSERFYNWEDLGSVTAAVMQKKAMRIRIPVWGAYTVALFAEIGSLFTGKPALLSFDKMKDIVQDYWTCDVSKAKQSLGYKEQRTLEEGIRETVEWYRTHGWF